MKNVLIVAFDGLQPAQVTPELMPNLSKLAAEGVTFNNNHAVFPTVTRINATTLVTGRYPGAHGLAANTLVVRDFDPYYLEVGHISPNSFATFDVQQLVRNQLRFNAIQHYDPWIIPNSIDFLIRTRDKYPLTNVVSHKFPIDKIDEAFKTAEWLGREGGSVVTRAVVTP